MSVEETALQEEVDGILQGPWPPVHAKWNFAILTPGGEEIEPIKIAAIDIDRDYINNYTDLTIVDVIFPYGTYFTKVVPLKENMDVRLIRYPKYAVVNQEEPPSPDNEGPIEMFFKGVLLEESNEVTGVQGTRNHSKLAMDLSDLIRVRVQLLDPAFDQFQKMETGGIFRDEVPLQVARYVLTMASNELDLPDEDAVYGVDVVEPDNKDPFNHIILPHGTKIWDAPSLIQRNWGGCYNTGIGCYLQGHLWYIWPQFNTRRFEVTENTLTVINLPPEKYPGVEKTWRQTERQVIALGTADSRHVDESHHNQLKFGSGERFTHGDRITDGFGEVKDNKFIMKRKENTSEYLAVDKEGDPLVGVSPESISNNSFSHASQFASRKGSFVHVVWEHSRSDLVYPGMPVKYMYLDHTDEVMEVEGVLVKAHHYIYDPETGIREGRFVCNTALTLFIENTEEE